MTVGRAIPKGRGLTSRRLVPSTSRSATAVAALKESEARLLLAAASAKLGVFESDVQARRSVWMNDRTYEIFGRSPTDGPITRQDFVDHYLHPDDVPPFEAARSRALRGDGGFLIECRIRLPGGVQRWLQIQGKFQFTKGSEP